MNFVPVVALGAGAIVALSAALSTTAATPEGQDRLRAAANAVALSVAESGQSAEQQVSASIEIWKFLFSTTFPVHLLDGENSRLVNPIVQAQGANPSSGGYAAGATPAGVGSTGGSQIADQTPVDYSRPVTELPAPGVMNQSSLNNMKDFFADTDPGRAINEITRKTSKVYDGQAVYQAVERYGDFIKKGDQIYLDGLHKDHLEVFNKRGKATYVLNLDGSVNLEKTKEASGRTIK